MRDALLFGPPTKDSLGAAATVAVELKTNPTLPAKVNIDGQMYTAPANLMLRPGNHQFSAISNLPDPDSPGVAFTFQCWIVNDVCVSSNATAILNVRGGACVVTAQYMLGASGWGAPAQPNSLPNPQGPMTPNLILVNPGPKEV